MKHGSDEQPSRTRRRLPALDLTLVKNVIFSLGGRLGNKLFTLITVVTAARVLGWRDVGLVFFADATSLLLFRLADFGLYQVIVRRVARGELGTESLPGAMLLRLLPITAITALFAPLAYAVFPERAGTLIGFFAASGLFVLHEIGRALLAGRERFLASASLMFVCGALGTAVSVAAMLAGAGLPGWLAGRVVGEGGLLLAVSWAIRDERRLARGPRAAELMREGLPFWLARLLDEATARLDVMLLTAWGGLQTTALYGIASRVLDGGLLLTTSLLIVVFPPLARDRRRFITRLQVFTIIAISCATAAAVALAAPWITLLVTGSREPDVIHFIRWLAPTIALAALTRPLESWLLAKDRERWVIIPAMVSVAISLVALVALIPQFGGTGAVAARVLRSAVGLALLAAAVGLVLSSARASSGLLRFVPGLAKRLMASSERWTRDAAERLMRLDGVRGVELTAPSPVDLDDGRRRITVIDASDHVDPFARLAQVQSSVASLRVPRELSIDVVDWRARDLASHLGDPEILLAERELLSGDRPEDHAHPACGRAWALGHSITLFSELQRLACEHGDESGRVSVRHLRRHIGALERCLQEVSGAELTQDGLARRLGGDVMTPHELGEALARGCRMIADALPRESDNWTLEPPERAHDATLGSTEARAFRERCAAVPLEALQLTKRDPWHDDPLLLAVVPAKELEDPEFWLAWVLAAARAGRLPPPFRSHRWPIAVPRAALNFDAHLMPSPLLHFARRRTYLDIEGSAPHGLRPDPAFLRHAARRTMARISLGLFALCKKDFDAEAARSTFVSLAALTLLAETGALPDDERDVATRYAERHDDAIAALLAARELHAGLFGAAITSWRKERTIALALEVESG
jgi:O-antigen/teichoic acid export membrane protein